MSMHETLGVYDYSKTNKVCDLYDSRAELLGQAYEIEITKEFDGTQTLSFKLPYVMPDGSGDNNFRWDFLKSEYLIRYTYGEKKTWFVANKPKKKKSAKTVYGDVTCQGYETLLKTRNLYMSFDDENGIGTIGYLMTQALKGTGWAYDSAGSDTLYERDNTTEKVRSLKNDGKKGSLDLVITICNLFQARPIFDTDAQTVTVKSINNRSQVLDGEVGRNLTALSVEPDSTDIVTRLYVEGEYGDYGYVGIDDVLVNGSAYGLPFIVNFDYYRNLGVFTQAHETALATYLTDIRAKKAAIKANGVLITTTDDAINTLIGQCKLAVYYKAESMTTPKYKYGDITDAQAALSTGDTVYILLNNNKYTKTTWNESFYLSSSVYGVAKFATPAAGKIGSCEVQIEAKEQEIALLNQKINATSSADKIAEYQAEISRLNTEISTIYDTATTGLYAMMNSIMNSSGLLYQQSQYYNANTQLNEEQDDIEATFIAVMGYMLRDGYWNDKNYTVGQEEYLYADAIDMAAQMGQPRIDYSFSYVRVEEDFGIPAEDIEINAVFKIFDKELGVDSDMYIKRITYGVDKKDLGSIEVSNQDITLASNGLGSLLSRMSQLADLIEQKNALYDRAKAISNDNTILADRLTGRIDAARTQILSTVSNWYTDDHGNIVFLSDDGGKAMMLSGAGFMIANSKDSNNEWNWRTFGTGSGFTADEIVAGFISADRIEAGTISVNKLVPNAGTALNISNNTAITDLNGKLAPAFSTSVDYVKGDVVMYSGKLYEFTSNHPHGAWNASHATETTLGAEINLVPGKISSIVADSLGNYSTTTQMNSAISLAVGDKYSKVSGIDITSAGIDVHGAFYVKIRSGGTFDVDSTNFKINSTSKLMQCGNWKLTDEGIIYVDSNEQLETFEIKKGYPSSSSNKSGIYHELWTNPSGRKFGYLYFAISGDLGSGYKSTRIQHTMSEIQGQANPILQTDCSTAFSPEWIIGRNSNIRLYADVVNYNSLVQRSSRDIKHNINPLPSVGGRLDQLQPVTFVYDNDEQERTRMGLIYEDAIEVMPEICTCDESNKAISYVELIPALLKEIQDLRKRVAELEQ